jgi:hypothetical protein
MFSGCYKFSNVTLHANYHTLEQILIIVNLQQKPEFFIRKIRKPKSQRHNCQECRPRFSIKYCLFVKCVGLTPYVVFPSADPLARVVWGRGEKNSPLPDIYGIL